MVYLPYLARARCSRAARRPKHETGCAVARGNKKGVESSRSQKCFSLPLTRKPWTVQLLGCEHNPPRLSPQCDSYRSSVEMMKKLCWQTRFTRGRVREWKSGHNSVTVQNRTHVYMNFFDLKDLGNHHLQLYPKVVKHPVYRVCTNDLHHFRNMSGSQAWFNIWTFRH
jgi:hypothetical protein